MAINYPINNQTATHPANRQRRPVGSIIRSGLVDPPPTLLTAFDEPPIALILPYIDTVEMTYPRLPKGLMAEAASLRGGKIFPRKIISDGRMWGQRLCINQPTPELLAALDDYGGCMSRFDVAYDIFPNDMSVPLLASTVRTGTILNWRRPQPMYEIGGTLYWTAKHAGKKRPDRNLSEYHDCPSKLTGQPAVHLELRFQTSDAVKAENLFQPSHLLLLSPRDLLDKHTRIVDFQDFMCRDIASSGGYTERTRHFYKRYYAKCAQLFKDVHPNAVKRMKALNNRFSMKDQLVWGAVSGPKDHLTWVNNN